DRRHLEAVAGETDGAIDAFQLRQLVDDRMPVGRDRVQGAVTAAAVAAVHRGITPAQALPYRGQPIAVGGFVVLVGIDRVLRLFTRDAAGVNHLAVRRLEVEPLHKTAIDGAAAAEIGRATIERDLRPARLHGQLDADVLAELRRPWAGRQHDAAGVVTTL